MIDWTKIFDTYEIQKGATKSEIEAFAKAFNLSLNAEEISEIKENYSKSKIDFEQYNPTQWVFPNKPLPSDFLDFLEWNNGGWCQTGEREFGFLSTFDLRKYTLSYMFPEWMPQAIPFALNGGGIFYIFDMRENPENGEYPILIADSANLGYEDAKLIANSFLEVCQGTTNVETLL